MVASKLKRLFGSVSKKPKKPPPSDSESLELSDKQVKRIEKTLGYVFEDKALLEQSLTHPSFLLNTRDQLKNNQRLEFLGDSVIQLVLTETLYDKFPKLREGKLTSMRSAYARGDYMAKLARGLRLGDFLLLKPKDRASGVADNDSALGDAFESLIGAVYLDCGWDKTRALILKLYDNLEKTPQPKGGVANPKGKLQEKIQPIHGNHALRYETTDQVGDAHERIFEVTVYCNEDKLGTGKGRTKKEGAEKAALEALASLKTQK